MGPETWQERLIAEKRDLEDKLNSLCRFLDDISDIVAKGMIVDVSAKQQRLLAMQKTAMTSYLQVLNERMIDLDLMVS